MNTTPCTMPKTRTPRSVTSEYLNTMPVSSSAQVTASAIATRRKVLSGLMRLCSYERALQEAGEEAETVGPGAGEVLDGVLGVRHQADHVAALVADPGDVAQRAVGIDVEVASDDPPLALEPVERLGVSDESALAVLEDDGDLRALVVRRGPGRPGVLDAQALVAADELAV